MEWVQKALGFCNSLQHADKHALDEHTSDIQLNAFEFRNYRTNLDGQQQKLVERILNQTTAILVKGKTCIVDGFPQKVLLDKDMLTLMMPNMRNGEFDLRNISKMELSNANEGRGNLPKWQLDITFDGALQENLQFNFEQERERLNFSIAMRLLRTRDPFLDGDVEVRRADEFDEDGDEEEKKSFSKVVASTHYNVESGIPVVFSVSDMKLYQKLQSTSRWIYIEFFVSYPHQTKFLYAKSPTTQIPAQVLQADDAGLRRKKEKKGDDDDDDRMKAENEKKREALGSVPIHQLKFDQNFKNVKLKVPKVPHTIFGRLMAKDEYFPTCVGTFDLEVKKSYLQDRRAAAVEEAEAEEDDGKRKEPVTLPIDVFSASRKPGEHAQQADAAGNPAKAVPKEEAFQKIGTLTMRLIGYVTDEYAGTRAARAQRSFDDAKKSSSPDRGGKASGGKEGAEDEESEEDDEEDEDEEEEEEEEEEESEEEDK